MRQVDEQNVKQQLLEQQRVWEAVELDAGCSEPQTIQFWSVGKLLRVLQASKSAAKPLETLAGRGITRHSVGSCDKRKMTSQPTAAETQHVPTADAVTYTSRHIWLTGFLHFGEELDTCDTFYLCDSNSKLPSFLLDPSPQLTDQLVLVKRWVLVDKAFGGVKTAGSMFLEVHDEKPMPLLPASDPYADWTQEDVIEVLEANYQTIDPPMYTGTEPWTAVAALSKRGGTDNGHVQTVMAEEKAALVGLGKHKKRRRVHAVFGRVTSVSPIARQKDRASSHFFVEIEHHRSCSSSAIRNVVNVMFTGIGSMRWHLFLRPGKIVLVTDLVKVYSRECDMFLLQATNGHQSEVRVSPTKGSLESSVLAWDELIPLQKNIARWLNDSTETYSKVFASRCCGKLFDYEGQVCRLLWDECIELQGPDEIRVIVCLFRFPYEHELIRLRKGAIVRVHDAHIVQWPTPVGGKLVIGLCPRGYLAITGYGEASGPCLVMGTRSRRDRASKKWFCMGDFHRQSVVLSMWLLEVLELMDAKFMFEGNDQAQNESALLSFSGLRRRQAAVYIAKRLGITLRDNYDQTAITLGALFLKGHSAGAADCSTIQLFPHEKNRIFIRAVTISELKAFGRSDLKKLTKSETGLPDGPLSVRISADNFDWCLLLGCIRGNVDSGDLEVFDRTGSIPLRLNGSGASLHFEDGHGVYLLQRFDLIIEDYNRVEERYGERKLPLMYCVSCSAADLEFVPMPVDEDISFSPEDETLTTTQEVLELLFMVTHVDALPRSGIRSIGLLPEYRIVHGIMCPVGEGLQTDLFMKAMHTAEVLVSSECRSWYVRKGFCYRIKAVEISQDSQTLPTSRTSIEGQAFEASRNYLEKLITKSDSVVCFDSLHHFHCEDGDKLSDEACSFRVYRMEGKRNQIIPVKLRCDDHQVARCELHELCRRSDRSESGMIVTRANDDSLPSKIAVFFSDAEQIVKQTPVKVSISELIAMSILKFFLRQSEKVSQVCSLIHHPLKTPSQQPVDDGASVEDRPVVLTVDPDLHKPHFTSVAGLITKKKYYWRANSSQRPLGRVGQSGIIGVKRGRESDNVVSSIADSSQRLLCIIHVRDLQHLDTVEIRVDASRFGLLGALRLNSIVELTRLQGFIARSSYKVYLNWSHCTAARLLSNAVNALVPLNSELYGAMPTTFLNDLYSASHVDRGLHRYVVGVMHISYVLLKRKCGTCHQALQFMKRRGCWKHSEAQVGSFARDCAWSRQQWAPSDPVFKARTYMGATVRCVIDDGSAQAELFLENGVAWELLTCTDGQRRRFEDILSNYVEELSYFSGRTAHGNFATSLAEREKEYYQNELRAFVLDVIPSLRSIVVFAQRFYKAKQQQERTSVLSFGKDIHLTTKTAPQPKLEAKRVDRVHVRSELQRRLRLRSKALQLTYSPVNFLVCRALIGCKGQKPQKPITHNDPNRKGTHMQDPPTVAEPKKPGSTRARKTTRAKKSAAESKKAATPRRRASPRNLRKAQEAEKQTEEKQADALEAVAASAVKEEQSDATQEVDKTENQQEELPPAKDTQLRRNYLQRIYRQLQSTHPNQDDGMIRQIATNVEMEACQASATRSQYVAAMDHEIHKLMQFEMQQANAPPVYTNDAQSFNNVQSNAQAQPVGSSEMPSGYSQQQMSQSRTFEYAQALAKAQSQEQASNGGRSSSFSTPRQSMSGDTSFQNLMNNPNPGYGRSSMQQQQQNTPTRVMNMQNLQQAGSPFYLSSSMAPPISQSFSQSNVGDMSGPRNMMEQQLGNFPMQQQMQQPGPMRTHSRPSTLQEFSAQIQHLDKSVLIELLWNQRAALAQWQTRSKHFELQLSAQKNAANNMGSPGFQSSPYRYNSPMVGGGTVANPNTSVEAEMQRACERSNSRIAQHQQHQFPQYPFAQQSNESSAGYSQAGGNAADWGENPQLYWEKIRLMKASYAEQLRTAQRALAQNTAPPNSLYSVKAQSMMQNIAMVLNILSERPTNVQPRKFDVLASIDRFMQMSVTPIVQKVLSSGVMPHMNTNSQTVVTSVPSPAVAASVATNSPGMPPARDNTAGMNNDLRQGTGNQYNGTRWASPVVGGVDSSRQSSRAIFADVEVKSSVDDHESGDNGSRMNTPTQMTSGLTPVGNSKPEYESAGYAPVRNENDAMANQTENSTYQYDAPTMTPKESRTPALPASESRPSSVTDTQLSPRASLSPDVNVRDSSSIKGMQPSSLDDSLHDFSYFPEMDFEDPVPESSNFVKENNPSNISRKRGIEDV